MYLICYSKPKLTHAKKLKNWACYIFNTEYIIQRILQMKHFGKHLEYHKIANELYYAKIDILFICDYFRIHWKNGLSG